jgi:hypothetical protein
METRVLAEGFGSSLGSQRRGHGRVLVVFARERCARGAIAVALAIDLGAEASEVVVEVVDLLLQRREVRRHLLELTAARVSHVLEDAGARGHRLGLLEVVAAVGRIGAVEVEVAATLTWRLAVALDLAPLALVAVGR